MSFVPHACHLCDVRLCQLATKCTAGCTFVYYCSAACREKDVKFRQHSKHCGRDSVIAGPGENPWEAYLPDEMVKHILSFLSPLAQQRMVLVSRFHYLRCNSLGRRYRMRLSVETFESGMEDRSVTEKLMGFLKERLESEKRSFRIEFQPDQQLQSGQINALWINSATSDWIAQAVKQKAVRALVWIVQRKSNTVDYTDLAYRKWICIIDSIIAKHDRRREVASPEAWERMKELVLEEKWIVY